MYISYLSSIVSWPPLIFCSLKNRYMVLCPTSLPQWNIQSLLHCERYKNKKDPHLTLSEKNNIKRRVGGKIHLLLKIQTFQIFLSTQYASNLCFSSQASQLTMGKIYKNKKDPHLTLAEKE